jgi:hypothetical protein
VNLRATSFATYQDLVNYIKCLQKGGSTDYCYDFGDNGVGASGKTTAQRNIPMCALNSAVLQAKWGTTSAAWGKLVRVTLIGMGHGNPFECEVADLGPEGVIDLNPASLISAGLPEDTELDCPASVEFLD